MKEFENLGFEMEDVGSAGYKFDYEGMHFLYMHNGDDEDFFSIALPGFYDYEEEKAAAYCMVAEKINSTLKYVKAYTLGDSMWLFYERELFGGEDMEALIQSMVMRLEAGAMFACKTVEEVEASFAKAADGTDDADGTTDAANAATGGESDNDDDE